MAGCPSSHQPTRIREETLESGGPLERKLNFRLHTHSDYIVFITLSILQFRMAIGILPFLPES